MNNYFFSSSLAIEKLTNRKCIKETPCQIFRRLGFKTSARLNNQTYEAKESEYKLCYSTIVYMDMAYNELLSMINKSGFLFINDDEEKKIKFILDKFHKYFSLILYQKSEYGNRLIELFDEAQKGWAELSKSTKFAIENVAYRYTNNKQIASHYAMICKVYNFVELGEFMRIALRFKNNDFEFKLIEDSLCKLLLSYINSKDPILESGNILANINRLIIPTFRKIVDSN